MPNQPKKIEDLTPEIMSLYGEMIKNSLPQGIGFSLILFEFGDGLREFKYISNAERADMLATLESLVLKWKNDNRTSED